MPEEILSAFVTLFVTIDPPGLAPVFLALTAGMTRAERAQVALRATLTAFGVLVLFAVAGIGILSVFGITIPAFRIAGGVLLFYIAFEMIFEKRQERQERSAERARTAEHIRSIAVFPLAIPLIAGPGAISATILLSGTYSQVLGRAVLIAVVAVNLAVAWLVFLLAEPLRPLPRRDRPHRADAAFGADPGGARRTVRRRRRACLRGPGRGIARVPPAPPTASYRNGNLAQNGISSSSSACILEEPLRSIGPALPNSAPRPERFSASPPSPRLSSMVSVALKPCRTTSVV